MEHLAAELLIKSGLFWVREAGMLSRT